jgi:hypothetical protein
MTPPVRTLYVVQLYTCCGADLVAEPALLFRETDDAIQAFARGVVHRAGGTVMEFIGNVQNWGVPRVIATRGQLPLPPWQVPN